MLVFSTQIALQQHLAPLVAQNLTVGFVPTMGALHQGHLALVKKALAENDIVVCSIFVNPTQFNNAKDLLAYPRLPEQDGQLLEAAGCHVLYAPEVGDIYPDGPKHEMHHFGAIETVMEGKYRPGHFAGVATVVNRLFMAVKPNRAYFGEKDFQQLSIIKTLVRQERLKIEIVSCPVVREADGLAMSSRNLRLSPAQRAAAPVIFESLLNLREMARQKDLAKAKAKTIEQINAHPELAVEYLEIADEETLQPIANWQQSKKPRAFAAVFCGEVRLIDNISLY